MIGNSTPWYPVHFPQLHLTLTICFTVFYSLTFIASYIQLWLVLYLGHKLVSTQTIYFFLCCLFSSQRIVLFCFFYTKTTTDENFSTFLSWFLISFPVVTQYMIVLLVTIFYYKTYWKTKGCSTKLTRNNYIIIIASVLAVLLVNMFNTWYVNAQTDSENNINRNFVSIQTIVTDLIFLATISIFVHIYRQFPKFPNAMLVLEVKRITKMRCVMVGICCITISVLKICYDISVVILNQKNITFKLPANIEKKNFMNNANSQRDEKDVWPVLIFGIILFLWEVAPLIAALILFRVSFPDGVCKIGKISSNKDTYKNLYSSTNTMNSSSTNKSKFIGVPRYGTVNGYVNSMDASSGTMSPNYFGSGYVFPQSYQRLDDDSYEHENTRKNLLKNNYQDKPSSYSKAQKRLFNPNNRYIWRSVSSKCLVKNKTIIEDSNPKTSSAQLSTANEE